ncbi:MAG: DUF4333 domain-containing protein [Rhodococcus sp.]|nr:DUF4333 domain-containing protein [Rhodococcus sp. (in: high G+C Gram-positive bacteria)]
MSGPYGPNDPNQQGGAQPEGQPGWGAPQPGQPQYGQSPQQWGPQPGQPYGQQPGQPYGQPGQQDPQYGQQPGWGAPQPGQMGQPTAQPWGAPQPGQQPGQQWGAPGQQWSPGPEPSGKSKTGMIVGLIIAALVVFGGIGVAIAFGAGAFGGKTLNADAANTGVERVLVDSYGVFDVTDVNCPSGQEVKSGNSFQCDLKVDGDPTKVTVTFTNDDGTYEVSKPN